MHEGQLFVEDMSTTEMSLLLMIATHLTKMDLPTLEKWNKKEGTQQVLFSTILFGLLVATHKQGNNWYVPRIYKGRMGGDSYYTM